MPPLSVLRAQVADDTALLRVAGVVLVEPLQRTSRDIVLRRWEVEAPPQFELEVLEAIEFAVREEKRVFAPGLFVDVERGNRLRGRL